MSRSSKRVASLVLATALSVAATASFGGAAGGAPAVTNGPAQTYIVLAPHGQSVARAVTRVGAAGGTVVAAYDEIGVVIASAGRADFATAVRGAGVDSAATTTGLGTRLIDGLEATVPAPDPITTGEALWANQWDMRAIQVAEAHTVTIGSPDVVVGVLDSGIDGTHPDLASQVDHSLSASCLGGTAGTARASSASPPACASPR
jgi:subtilisin family serine protease